MSSENANSTLDSSEDKSGHRLSVTDLSPNKKPIFRNLVTRLQIASRLSRAQRTDFEEENDVVADDQEIKHFAQQSAIRSLKRFNRPKTLTIRQLSKLSAGSHRRSFNRLDSKVSDISGNTNEEEEFEDSIISDGIIHFWKQISFDEGHPFLKVTTNVDIEVVAKVMHKCWNLNVPKIVTFIVSNKCHSTNWTNQRQIKNFQKGLIAAAISTNMWIFTNGFNSGVANLIGNAVKHEIYKMRIKRTLKSQNLTNLIGVVTESDIRYGELMGAANKEHINIENEGISFGDKYELNANHTHFIVIRDKQNNSNSVDDFTMKFIELLTRESQTKTKTPEKVATTPDSLDFQTTIESTEVPVVSIVIEGDCETAKLVLDLIKKHIPVVILRGSGGIADMIAFAYLEIIHRSPRLNSWDLEFVDQYLKPMLTKKIISCFHDLRDNALTRNILRDRIIECVRLCKTEERIYLTVLNMHNSSSCSLDSLSEHLLLALLKSRQSNETLLTENFQKDLELTMDWNCAHVAKDVIFAKNANNIAKLDKNLFESALMRPNREDFIGLFLNLGFQLHKFLSPSRLNRLFKLIHENEFYRTHCWENILGRTGGAKLPKYFIDNDLNWLIEICTGLDNFVNTEHLHLNVMGLYSNDSLSAERKALTLLSIWAVMQNRPKLAKMFWKHSDQPVHLALVISMLFDRLSWYAADNNMKLDLKQNCKQFADYANGVLDASYSEDISRANNVLNQSIQDWNYKTAVDIAANAQLRQFLAHPCCQKFLTNTFLGNIRLREINWGIVSIPPSVKIVLCALFVFPLFVWVRFKSNELELVETCDKDEEFEDVYEEIYNKEDNTSVSNRRATEDTIDPMKIGYVNPTFRKSVANSCDTIINLSKTKYNNYIRDKMFVIKQPPLGQMLVMFFSAPITKFYVSQLFYLLFLPLLSLSVIYPSCGNWKLDVLVCFWTTILCIDYMYRTFILIRKYTAIPVFLKCVEISLIIVFIVLLAITRVLRIHIYSPYKQKLLLSVGVLYFYYRLIGIYLPISPTLGPLLHRLKLMITVDFVNYMRIAFLVILSNMIVMQAVLYPDTEFTVEMFHKAFHRAFFSLFMTPVVELETNDYCEQQTIDQTGDQCYLTGRYNNTACANSGVWAYAFFIQYFVFLKLILSTLLMAIFAATASKLQTETDNIWKFQRYLLVIDFSNRLPLPAPLSVFHYIYFIYQYFRNLFCNLSCCANKNNNKISISNPNEMQERHKLTAEECIYWRQLASDYIDELEANEAKEQIPSKQWEYIQTISEDMEYEKKILREIKGNVKELERIIFCDRFSLNNLNITTQESNKECLKTSLSRYSPYPGTRISRVPLSEKYIPWEVMHIDYEPIAYTKPSDEFSKDMQQYVDEDIILLKELKSRNSSIKVKFPNYDWNCAQFGSNGLSINRISWQIKDDGTALQYKLEDKLIPRNPFGRTGLRGRGDLPRWGPNHFVLFVITKWQKKSSSQMKNKNLELIIEQIENQNQNLLPERFISGDDLFGELQNLFNVDSKSLWILPEVIRFFKSMCLSQESEEFSFKLIRNGYIDDPRNTDNAWKEVKVWHIHYECRQNLKKHLVKSSLSWRLLSDNLFSKMPLSHSHIIKSVVDALKADII